jgi:hypothetical protein
MTMKLTHILAASVAILGTLATAAPASAQTAAAASSAPSSYTPGSVWVASRIDVLPGQLENYMDYLATTWKRVQELGKRDGMILSYRVLEYQNARQGEPDLLLLVEYKDFLTTAQQVAMQNRVEALLSQNARTAATASGQRAAMREPMGSIMFQELTLK